MVSDNNISENKTAWWKITMPYGSKLHTPHTNHYLLAAQQKPCKKAYLSMKNTD